MNLAALRYFMAHQSEIVKVCGRTAFCVCVDLAYRANEQTGSCFPSRKTIAADVSCRLNTVRDALLRLRIAGYLDWEQSNGRSNHYTFPEVDEITQYEKGRGGFRPRGVGRFSP